MPPKQGLGGQGRWALPQQDHGIGLIQGIFLGHAQRSRRQNPIIPKPIRGIHHQKRQILDQRGILKAIIQNQKVRPRIRRGLRRHQAGFGHKRGGKGCRHQGFIPHIRQSVLVKVHPQRGGVGAFIPFVNQGGMVPLVFQKFRQSKRYRGFSRPAHHRIAHTDHGFV